MFSNLSRRLNGIISAAQSPVYSQVPFVKEPVAQVSAELPRLNYYELEVGGAYPYSSVSMSESIPVEASDLPAAKPEYEFSELENGVRVVSMDNGGHTANLGVFVGVGSRHEGLAFRNASHMIECMAYKSTGHLSFLRTIKTFETMGAQASATVGREHLYYSAEILREYAPLALPLLVGNVLFPRFLPWEIKETQDKLLKASENLKKNPEQWLTHLMMETGFDKNTLGAPLYTCPRTAKSFQSTYLRNFMMGQYFPKKTVVAGVNVNHQELATWAMRAYVDYNEIPNPKTETAIRSSEYSGGFLALEDASIDMTHLAIGFGTKGYEDPNLAAYVVLQTLLGGGGSFSVGGPGKGMQSRLFTNVLARYHFVESAMAFHQPYSDGGLFGLFFTVPSMGARGLVGVIKEELSALSSFTPEELERAKNSAVQQIYVNLESSMIQMEDVATQLLRSNRVISGLEFGNLIRQVEMADLVRAAQKLLAQEPTVVAVGDVSEVPSSSYFSSLVKSIRSTD